MRLLLAGFLAVLAPAAAAFDRCAYLDTSASPPRPATIPCPESVDRRAEDLPPMPLGTIWTRRAHEREYWTRLYLRRRPGEALKPMPRSADQPYTLAVIRYDSPRGAYQINPKAGDYLERALDEEAIGRGAWARVYAEDGLVLAPEDARLREVAARHEGENLSGAGLRAAAFDAYANAHRALERGKPETSPAWLARSLALWPTVDAYSLSAHLALKLKDYRAAREAAEAGLRMAPEDFMLKNVREQAEQALAAVPAPVPAPVAAAVVSPIPAPPSSAGAAPGKPLLAAPEAVAVSPVPAVVLAATPRPASPVPRPADWLAYQAIAAGFIALVSFGVVSARRKLASKSAAPSWDAATAIGGTSLTPPTPAPTPGPPRTTTGRVHGRYELLRQIGSGGMGVVYEGLERPRGRRVAIKQMRPEIKDDEGARADFKREAEIISRLNHPNIVAFHELLESDGELLLVFDYVDGRALSDVLREKKRLTVPETQRIFTEVCEAMSSAHRAHVMHRDLKPANIMIDERGRAMVMDFGIARAAKDTITRLTRIDGSGTPAYMAPEQHLGRFAKASDIYALGVCLYQTLTGQLPFPGPDFLVQKERMTYIPPRFHVPSLPQVSELLFQVTLAADPAKRVADAEELIDSIRRLSA